MKKLFVYLLMAGFVLVSCKTKETVVKPVVEDRIVTYDITFDVGKAIIKAEGMAEIYRIKSLMDQDPNLKFEVQGHTDITGTTANNQKLSEQRAQNIVAKLIELGVSADRLRAVGKGETEPIADNTTEEGRALNRRVVFEVIK